MDLDHELKLAAMRIDAMADQDVVGRRHDEGNLAKDPIEIYYKYMPNSPSLKSQDAMVTDHSISKL